MDECPHGFSTPDVCPTCEHFRVIKERETEERKLWEKAQANTNALKSTDV